MPRKKKTEEVKEEFKKDPIRIVPEKNFGTGFTRINNMLQAGYSLEEIKEKKDE